MRIAKELEGRKCPKCNSVQGQSNYGFNKSGTQRCICNSCKFTYTHNPKSREKSDEVKALALRTYYSGVSARGVGKIFGMSHINVMNWIKKNSGSVDKSADEI
jgi:transposase-like protein